MTVDQETPEDRARRHADAVADGLNEARISISIALGHVEHVESVLQNTLTRLPELNTKALSLVMRDKDDLDNRWGDLRDARQLAANLVDDVRGTQRVMVGTPGPYDGVDRASGAADELTKAARMVANAAEELDKLAAIPDHDRDTVTRLRAQAALLGSAAEQTHAVLQGVQPALDSARQGLHALNDDRYLTSMLEPGVQAERIMTVEREVQERVGVAKSDVARAQGMLGLAESPAANAARDSAELAAMKGLNPPVPEERRTDAGSSGGAAATSAGQERDTASRDGR